MSYSNNGWEVTAKVQLHYNGEIKEGVVVYAVLDISEDIHHHIVSLYDNYADVLSYEVREVNISTSLKFRKTEALEMIEVYGR